MLGVITNNYTELPTTFIKCSHKKLCCHHALASPPGPQGTTVCYLWLILLHAALTGRMSRTRLSSTHGSIFFRPFLVHFNLLSFMSTFHLLWPSASSQVACCDQVSPSPVWSVALPAGVEKWRWWELINIHSFHDSMSMGSILQSRHSRDGGQVTPS